MYFLCSASLFDMKLFKNESTVPSKTRLHHLFSCLEISTLNTFYMQKGDELFHLINCRDILSTILTLCGPVSNQAGHFKSHVLVLLSASVCLMFYECYRQFGVSLREVKSLNVSQTSSLQWC
jgi:hypothetical protein